jgi:hypothetical protein
VSTEGDVVHGLRAAARLTGWSPSGLQKMIDGGRVKAERDGRTYTFRVVDLEAIRRAPGQPQASGFPTTAAPASVAGPSAATPADATTLVVGRPEIAAPANAGAEASDMRDAGAIASIIFGDLAAGRTLVQIVAERKVAPDVVRHHHDRWRELQAIDEASTPSALERLARVEATVGQNVNQFETGAADVQALSEQLATAQAGLDALADQFAGTWRHFDGRLRGLDTRVNIASRSGMGASISQRLGVLEQQMRNLPGALVPIGHRCPGCGSALIVAASCSGCGAGRMAG